MVTFNHKVALLLLLVFLSSNLKSIGINTVDAIDSNQMDNPQKDEAQSAWEKAIAAKGGRERLEIVKNLIISRRSEYVTHTGNKNSWYREEIIVLPDKYWLWNDMRPDVFGLRIEMANYETKMAYVVTPESSKEDEMRPVSLDQWEKDTSLVYPQLIYFMETKWVKPKPISLRKINIGNKQVRVLKTSLNGKRIDFTLDPETNLPIKVSFFDRLKVDSDELIIHEVDLSDYKEVKGIKIPQRLAAKAESQTSQIEINLEYEKNIFICPTTVEAGPDAWMKKDK